MTAARFWLRDIWGPQWDAERRSLLFQHYWSYARHPAVPAVYVPTGGSSYADQRAFARAYWRRIESVQRQARDERRVRLTYRPIGKNLRLVATAIRRNADRGMATVIAPEGPDSEARALAAKGHRWSPWLWSRSSAQATDAMPADQSWCVLFARPVRDGRARAGAIPASPQWHGSGSGALTAGQLARVLKLAVATDYAFSPVHELLAEAEAAKAAMRWPSPGVPVLGIHVRRGDAASSEAGPPRTSNRASFGIAQYLEAADPLCESNGIRHIFLATESSAEIARAAALRPHYTFLTVPHDRSLFPDIATSGQYIEELALSKPERAQAVARMAILDLQMFRGCQAFVGAFNSEFSMLAWLLSVGGQGHVVPFVSLSEPAREWRLHPYDALLNLRNNCPLELYHW